MKTTLDTQLLDKYIRQYLDGCHYLTKIDNGIYTGTIYTDYNDQISDKKVVEICQAGTPYARFSDILMDWYSDTESDLRCELSSEILASCPKDLVATLKEERYDIERYVDDYIADHVEWDYQEDHFLDQKYDVTIVLDTGDGNYDYGLNSQLPPCWYQNKHLEDVEKCSLIWLANQQGYTTEQFIEAMHEESKSQLTGFLASCWEELENLPTHMSAVTFLVEMSLQDLLKINTLLKLQDKDGKHYDATQNPDCGEIVLDKSTCTGLFDPWNGSGSILEIKLDKDVCVPIKYIRSALPDGGDGCFVRRVYGLSCEAWQPTLKEIKEPTGECFYAPGIYIKRGAQDS